MPSLQQGANKSVDRALCLLDIFSEACAAVTANQIAAVLETSRATIYPTLNALLAHKYLDRDKKGRFTLGMQVVERAGVKLSHLDIRNLAQERLRALARSLGVSVHLATLHDSEVLYLGREEGLPNPTLHEIVGRRVSPHCTALGKALLAFLPQQDRERIARNLHYICCTPHTISNSEDYLRALDVVREDGYALEMEEFHLGSACIAAPIRYMDGQVAGAISASVATSDLKAGRMLQLATIVVKTANATSNDLQRRKCSSNSEPRR